MREVVVVGASLAGFSAARTLRAGGFDGTITLVGAEQHMPYERPPLSKKFLTGATERAHLDVVIERPGDYTWRLGTRAKRLNLERRLLELEDGDELRSTDW
jgi:NADPH-dependent 2,4-dienoyl-CoA reductase/sulfur reductase-like enzyme